MFKLLNLLINLKPIQTMKTEHVIRVKKTHDVVYTGINLEDCKQAMKPAFFDHINKGLGLEDFPLEAVTIHSLEESEMDIEDEEESKDFDEDDLPF